MPRKSYDGIMVSTTLHGIESSNMGAVERKRLNVQELRYLKSIYREKLIHRVRNKEMRSRTVFVKELADRAEQGEL